MFAQLMEKTEGMTSDQVKEYLKTQPHMDGKKIMHGEKGYMALTGAFSGTM